MIGRTMLKKPKLKLLKLSQVLIDEELYPRSKVDFITVARYINAMRSGAEFPPIVVGLLNGKYYLIDGGHRLQAHKGTKQTHIQAEVIENLDEKGIYLEAVKRNMTHGKQFNTYEVTNIIVTLENFKLTPKEVADIVRIPAKSLKSFVAKRMTRITDTNEDVVLKKPFRHMSQGSFISSEDNFKEFQKNFSGSSQEHILSEVIKLFENNLIDIDTPAVVRKVKKLKKLLVDYE